MCSSIREFGFKVPVLAWGDEKAGYNLLPAVDADEVPAVFSYMRSQAYRDALLT